MRRWFINKAGIRQVHDKTAFGRVQPFVLFRPLAALRWRSFRAATLMTTTPDFAQRVHITVEDREQPVLRSAVLTARVTSVIAHGDFP
jgi:hypothetical protein